MFKNSTVFLIIAIIAVIEMLNSEVAMSVVPGWHITIASPHMLLSIGLLIWLFLLVAGYYILERTAKSLMQRTVKVHMVLTLFYFLISNNFFLFNVGTNAYVAVLLPLVLFTTGQVYFVFHWVRTMLSA